MFPLSYVDLDTFQLGPWLAVEIPDLISKDIITHKEKKDRAER